MKTFNKSKQLQTLFDKWEEAQLNESTNSLSLTLSGKNISGKIFFKEMVLLMNQLMIDKEQKFFLFLVKLM